MRIAEAFVEIRVDRKQAEGEAKSAANGALSAIKNVFAAGVVIKGIQEAIGQASDLNETISKTGVIFGDSSKDITAWSQNSAKQLGLSQRAALDAASTFATFGKGAGIAGDDLTGFSTKLVGLSSDLASFYNSSPEEAINAIGAALRGESEPIRQFGVLLDDATLKQRAMTLGIYDGSGALTQQQRVLAAQAEIIAQTSDAQGDFARTADGVANSQRIAAAEAENSAASFGQVLLPVYDKVLSVVTFLVDKFGDLPGPLQTAVVALAGMVAFSGPIGTIKDVVVDLAGALVKVSGSATAAYGALGAVGGVLALAGGLYLAYNQDKQRAKAITDDFVSALQAETQGQKDATRALIARQIVDSKYLPLSEKLGLSIGDVASVITGKSVPAYDKARAGIDAILDSTAGYNVKNYELQEQYGITADEAANFRAEIDRLATGYGAAVVETNKLDAANKALGVGTKETAGATADAAARAAEYAGSVEILTPAIDEAAEAEKAAADASKKLADRQKDATQRAEEHRKALEDLYDTLLSQIDAEYAYEKASASQGDAVRELDSVLADKESTLINVRDALFGAKDASLQMAEAFVASKGATLDSKAGVDLMIESLYNQAVALGPDSPLRQELLDYIAELQKIPSQIDTSIRLSVTGQTVNINPSRAGDVIGIRSLPSVAVASAAGRYVPGRSNLLSTFGEQGPEAILPLDKPGRLEQLLGDQRIGEPVAAAMGGTTTTKSSPIVLNNYRRDLTVHDVAQLVTIARLSQ